MTNESNDVIDLDALADELFGTPSSSSEDAKEEPKTDELGESGEQATQVAPSFTPEQVAQLIDQGINQRMQQAALQQSQSARLAEIQRLLTEGSDEEAGQYIKQQFAEARVRSTYGDQAISGYSASILDTLLPDDYVAQLPVEDRKLLADMAEASKTDAEYFYKVAEFKTGKTHAQREEDVFKKAVDEAVKAKLNEQKGQQFKQTSPSGVPSSKGGKTESYDSDSLWNDAFAEMANT